MPNPFFRFKQFVVYHDRCAMKVGTDGVLLGAWTRCGDAKNILDVGTGSGLVALMLAQRSEAQITAVDIDKDAALQAAGNFSRSSFADRLVGLECDFLVYQPATTFDLIVSNPPYFSQSLKTPSRARNLARHDDSLPLARFVRHASTLLSNHGRLALIVPSEAFNDIHAAAQAAGLHLARKTIVRSLPDNPPKRLLLEYSVQPTTTKYDDFFIEHSRHQYSNEYIRLTQDYYLNM